MRKKHLYHGIIKENCILLSGSPHAIMVCLVWSVLVGFWCAAWGLALWSLLVDSFRCEDHEMRRVLTRGQGGPVVLCLSPRPRLPLFYKHWRGHTQPGIWYCLRVWPKPLPQLRGDFPTYTANKILQFDGWGANKLFQRPPCRRPTTILHKIFFSIAEQNTEYCWSYLMSSGLKIRHSLCWQKHRRWVWNGSFLVLFVMMPRRAIFQKISITLSTHAFCQLKTREFCTTFYLTEDPMKRCESCHFRCFQCRSASFVCFDFCFDFFAWVTVRKIARPARPKLMN